MSPVMNLEPQDIHIAIVDLVPEAFAGGESALTDEPSLLVDLSNPRQRKLHPASLRSTRMKKITNLYQQRSVKCASIAWKESNSANRSRSNSTRNSSSITLVRRGSGRLLVIQPWVYQSDTQGVEVLRIARNDGEAMLNGCAAIMPSGALSGRPINWRIPSSLPHRAAIACVTGRTRPGKRSAR